MSAPGPHLGIYAHHRGAGHIARAHAIARAWPGQVTLLTSRTRSLHAPDDLTVLHLPPDEADGTGARTPRTLHHAPLRHDGLRRRMATISAWLGGTAPDVVLVDVSVEVALLTRLHGVPTAVVRHPGERDDVPHSLQWATVDRVVAPWGRPGERDGVHHVGLLSRFDHRTGRRRRGTEGLRWVLVAVGAGGTDAAPAHVARLADELGPGWRVSVLGARWSADRTPSTATHLGWMDDPWPALCASDVVVGSCSLNLTAEVAASGAAFVAVPEGRPHWEQHAHGEELAEQGVPVASSWDDDLASLVRRAAAAPPPVLSDRRGAQRLVDALTTLARTDQELPA